MPDQTGQQPPDAQPQEPQVQTEPQLQQDQGQQQVVDQGAQQDQQQDSGWLGTRDWAKQYHGVDLSNYRDDSEALQALLQSHQQAQQLQQQHQQLQQLAYYGNEYLQNYDFYRQAMAQRASAPAGAASVPSSTGAAPPPISYDEVQRLTQRFFTTDPQTGQLVPNANAPASAIEKVYNYAHERQEWDTKLRHNPKEALQPYIQEAAQQLLKGELASYQSSVAATEILRGNANWLFYADPYGNPVMGRLTPQGMAYNAYLRHFDQLGIKDPYTLDRLAKQQMHYEALLAQQRQQPQPQPQKPQAPKTTRNGTQYTNRLDQQAVPNGAGNFRAMLEQAFSKLTDDDIQPAKWSGPPE